MRGRTSRASLADDGGQIRERVEISLGKVMLIVGRAVVVAGIAMSAGSASAHPVHEVVQNAYLTLTPGAVELQLELTAGPRVAGRIIRVLDVNRDKKISVAEAHAYADRVLAASRLTIDGRVLVIRTISVDVPSYAALLGAHGTIRIVAAAPRSDRSGAAVLEYRNAYNPAESRCDANIFLKPGNKAKYRIIHQDRSHDGRQLVVRFDSRLPKQS